MSINEAFYIFKGLGYSKGLENEYSKDYFINLMNKCHKAHPTYDYSESVLEIILVLLRKEEILRRPCPAVAEKCRYRRAYPENGYALQKNALRIEIITGGHKCFASIKPGYIGGHEDDYSYCCGGNK